jgi:hypothetical protein
MGKKGGNCDLVSNSGARLVPTCLWRDATIESPAQRPSKGLLLAQAPHAHARQDLRHQGVIKHRLGDFVVATCSGVFDGMVAQHLGPGQLQLVGFHVAAFKHLGLVFSKNFY